MNEIQTVNSEDANEEQNRFDIGGLTAIDAYIERAGKDYNLLVFGCPVYSHSSYTENDSIVRDCKSIAAAIDSAFERGYSQGFQDATAKFLNASTDNVLED